MECTSSVLKAINRRNTPTFLNHSIHILQGLLILFEAKKLDDEVSMACAEIISKHIDLHTPIKRDCSISEPASPVNSFLDKSSTYASEPNLQSQIKVSHKEIVKDDENESFSLLPTGFFWEDETARIVSSICQRLLLLLMKTISETSDNGTAYDQINSNGAINAMTKSFNSDMELNSPDQKESHIDDNKQENNEMAVDYNPSISKNKSKTSNGQDITKYTSKLLISLKKCICSIMRRNINRITSRIFSITKSFEEILSYLKLLLKHYESNQGMKQISKYLSPNKVLDVMNHLEEFLEEFSRFQYVPNPSKGISSYDGYVNDLFSPLLSQKIAIYDNISQCCLFKVVSQLRPGIDMRKCLWS